MAFNIQPCSHEMIPEIMAKINAKTKPLGSLGTLEELAQKIALIRGKTPLDLPNPRLILFAGDHGLADEGVSPYPKNVTFEMVRNFVNKGAAINVFANQHGIKLDIVDTGVITPSPWEEVIDYRLGEGTSNSLKGPAMTEEQFEKAIANGSEIVEKAFQEGCRAIGFGEMGIGNSSAAALITSMICDASLSQCVGRGTGCNDQQLLHKAHVLNQVRIKHSDAKTPQEIMRRVGGFEMATALGAMLKAAELKMVTLIDGFIMGSVALCAAKWESHSLEYMIFCHHSASPGHDKILEELNVKPVLDLKMRLGEGSGVAVCWPILESACRFFNEMASFAEAEVSEAGD